MRNEKIIKSPSILFTGAGASRSFGKWLMHEFIINLIPRLKSDDLRQLLATFVKYRTMDLEEILKELNEIIEKEYLAVNELNYIIEHLEDDNVINQLKASMGEKPGFSLESGKILPNRLPFSYRFEKLLNNCKELKNQIEQLIFDHYSDIQINQVDKAYFPVIERLPFGKRNILPIFTTNYDLTIEKFATTNPLHFSLIDGFMSSPSRTIVWHPDRFDKFEPDSSKLNIILFKLHGSVCWYEEGGTIKYLDTAIHRPEGEKLKNVLIYPAKKKITLDEPFFTCYDYFQRCLDHAKIAIFIGYSFRDYDTITKIKSALSFNQEIKIFVLDPNAKNLINENFLSFADRFEPLNYKFYENADQYLEQMVFRVSGIEEIKKKK